MVTGDHDFEIWMDNMNQLGFEKLVLEWSTTKNCIHFYSPHHDRTMYCSPEGKVRGLNQNRCAHEVWYLTAVS